MNFFKQNIADIPLETANNGSGSRQMLLNPDTALSTNWEAVTKGFLSVGSMFDWHLHEDSDEIFLVTRGEGEFYCEEEITNYKSGDVILVRANVRHKIVNNGQETTEGFFIRIKV